MESADAFKRGTVRSGWVHTVGKPSEKVAPDVVSLEYLVRLWVSVFG